MDRQVFISYAWGGESELVANELEAVLRDNSFQLVRDKNDLGFKGLIRQFMEQIGQGSRVVLIISDKYLKSKNCMFELMEVAKKGEFHDRVFPIVLPDADIYDSLGIINYLKYWDQKIKELNARVRELDNLADTRKVQDDINLYTDIRGILDDLAGKLSDMNTLTLEIMRSKKYQPLLDSLREKVHPAPSPSRKEGKVIYHIPGMMQVQRWTRCTVRLAWEESILTEGLKIPEHERTIESIRLGNVMQVSLLEGADGNSFDIKALNNEEQAVFEDDFSEWLFDVKPLTIGNFVLILRVTLIQIIEGKERKKDIVLERNVITEASVPQALPRFETAESGLKPSKLSKENLDQASKEDETIANPDLDEICPELAESEDPPFSGPEMMGMPSPFPTRTTQEPDTPVAPTGATRAAPPPSKSPLRFAPYAAGLVGIVMVGYFGLVINSQDSFYTTDSVTAPSPEKMVISLTLEATGPSGEKINDIQVFAIAREQLDSLSLIDFGSYTIATYPASDTLSRELREIEGFTVLQIKDSMEAVNKKPIRLGDKLVDRKTLRLNTVKQAASPAIKPQDD